MVAAVRAVSKPRGRKAGRHREAGYPVAMKECVELLGCVPTAQMDKIVLPDHVMRRVLQFKERENQPTAKFERTE